MWQNPALYASVEGGQDAINDPAIVHYPGGGKPWLRGGSVRPAAKHYWKYALRCPYAEEIIQVYRQSCQDSVASYSRLRRRLVWYQFLASVLWGRRRRHYTKKVADVRRALDEIKHLKMPERNSSAVARLTRQCRQ